MPTLREIKDMVARAAYGMTKDEAHAKGVCIVCKKPPIVRTELERNEYRISAICPPCFAQIKKELEDADA